MPKYHSIYWDEDLGVCTKHAIPQTPCPVCMSGDGDEDLEIIVTAGDQVAIDFGATVRNLLPTNLVPAYEQGKLTIHVY